MERGLDQNLGIWMFEGAWKAALDENLNFEGKDSLYIEGCCFEGIVLINDFSFLRLSKSAPCTSLLINLYPRAMIYFNCFTENNVYFSLPYT